MHDQLYRQCSTLNNTLYEFNIFGKFVQFVCTHCTIANIKGTITMMFYQKEKNVLLTCSLRVTYV